VTVIASTTINFAQGNDYVVAAEGPYASIGSNVFPHALSTVDPSATRIQVLNAAPSAPALAVFLTAPGADLAASTPLGSGNLAFMGATAPSDVTSGSYEIRITAAGTTTPVLFDSGAINLLGGQDLVITALQNVGPGTAPVVLGLTDAFGNNSTLFDLATPATLRVVNASPDSPPLSVISNGNIASPLVPSLAFESFTPYAPLTPGFYTFTLTPASNTAQVVATEALALNAGAEQTIYALGAFASLGTESTFDNRRRVATGAKLRLVQASPGASFVDVYLTAPGSGIASMSPAFGGLPFGGDTGFQQVAAGSYDLTITTAGTQTVLSGPTTVSLTNTGIYTVASRDAPGGGAPYGLIMMDDFAP
jgi:trimeric autotransporter adhesin